MKYVVSMFRNKYQVQFSCFIVTNTIISYLYSLNNPGELRCIYTCVCYVCACARTAYILLRVCGIYRHVITREKLLIK